MRSIALLVVILAVGCVEEGPPEFIEVTRSINTTSAVGPYRVLATVVDDGEVTQVALSYRVDGGDPIQVAMDRLEGSVWRADIPGQPAGSTIDYRLGAVDDDDHETFSPPDTEASPFYRFEILAP